MQLYIKRTNNRFTLNFLIADRYGRYRIRVRVRVTFGWYVWSWKAKLIKAGWQFRLTQLAGNHCCWLCLSNIWGDILSLSITELWSQWSQHLIFTTPVCYRQVPGQNIFYINFVTILKNWHKSDCIIIRSVCQPIRYVGLFLSLLPWQRTDPSPVRHFKL